MVLMFILPFVFLELISSPFHELLVTDIVTGHDPECSQKFLYCQMNETVGRRPVVKCELHLPRRQGTPSYLL